MEYLDLKSNNERLIINLAAAGLNNVMLLGHYSYNEAKKSLSMHKHDDMLEICFLDTGYQYYQVGDDNYLLKGGDLLITPPNIMHGTSGYPEEKGSLFWMIIKVPRIPFQLMNLSAKESQIIIDRILGQKSLHFKGSSLIKKTLTQIFRIYNNRNNSLRIVELKNQILAFLLEVLKCGDKLSNTVLSPDIDFTIKYISENIYERISLEYLAKSVNLSESRFKHKFKEELGVPPNEYILIEKIKKAKEIIKNQESSLTNLAYDLGFSTSSYFSTVFKKFEGMSPSKYKSTLI